MSELEKAIRELVKVIYIDLNGSCGGGDYEGQFEYEIQNLINVIEKMNDPLTFP